MHAPTARLIAVIVTVAVLLAACDGTDDAAEPAAGGTLRVALPGELSLDPARAVDRAQIVVADLVYETLVTLDAETLEAAPGLAAEWEVSDDQQRFTFTLREDARFHDGTPVTAAAVAASWARVVDPATESPLASLLEPVAGYGEARDGGGMPTGVTTPDDTTVVVELSAPVGDFPANLAHPGLGIVPAGAADGAESTVGSGPFAVDSYDVERLRLTVAQGGETLVEGIEVDAVADGEAAVAAVERGDADLALVPGDSEIAGTLDEVRAASLAVSYYAMNMSHAELADERLRRAIALAIDPASVVEAGYGDAAEVGVSVAPEPLPGVGPRVCGDRCGPDRDAARALLDEVFGDTTPSTITVDFDETDVQTRVASELARQLETVGIPVELRPVPAAEYDAFLTNGDPMVFRFGWVSDVPSVREFLDPVFRSGAPENVAAIDSPSVAQALDAAATTPDADERAAAYRSAQRAILDTAAVIPVAQLVARYAVGSAVRDLEVSIYGAFSGAEIWLERED